MAWVKHIPVKNMKRFIPLIIGLIGFYVLMFLWGIAWENEFLVIILSLIFGPFIYGIIFIWVLLIIGYLKEKFVKSYNQINLFKEETKNKRTISIYILIWLIGAFVLFFDWFFGLFLF